MRFILSLSVLLLISCAHRAEKSLVTPPREVNWQEMWVQNGCKLYNFKRVLKTFPGSFCIFLDDGSFLSANSHSLKKFSPSKEVLWEVPGHFHHQLNITPDKKRIMALSSSLRNENEKVVRDDAFLIFDLEGKLLLRAVAPSFLKESNVRSLAWPEGNDLLILKADYETSHFNSFYEIPENAYSKSVPWMEKGNFILNSAGMGIFIISSDLSKVLKFIGMREHGSRLTHDAQVSSDGTILSFINYTDNPENVRFSSIQKFDPVTGKIKVLFQNDPKEIFYSPACSGVQELGDLIFFSHMTAGGYLWSPGRNKLVKAVPGANDDPTDISTMQQLKLVDVKDFFKNSR